MSIPPVVITRVFNAPRALVWKAFTEKDHMKEWYFDLDEFKPIPGFTFRFPGGPPEDPRRYTHVCTITEVVPESKLAHTWKYEGYEGDSLLTFELADEGDGTRLTLTHSGLGTFPADNPDFARGNFETGWNDIIGVALEKYLESIRKRN